MARIEFTCFRTFHSYCLCGLDNRPCDLGHTHLSPFAGLNCVAAFNPGSICLQDHGETLVWRV